MKVISSEFLVHGTRVGLWSSHVDHLVNTIKYAMSSFDNVLSSMDIRHCLRIDLPVQLDSPLCLNVYVRLCYDSCRVGEL